MADCRFGHQWIGIFFEAASGNVYSRIWPCSTIDARRPVDFEMCRCVSRRHRLVLSSVYAARAMGLSQKSLFRFFPKLSGNSREWFQCLGLVVSKAREHSRPGYTLEMVG